jgi:hypothetical protein
MIDALLSYEYAEEQSMLSSSQHMRVCSVAKFFFRTFIFYFCRSPKP